MKRREFITLLGGAAASWPLAVHAQQAREIPRIGVLWHAANKEEEGEYFTSFEQGIRDLGYIEGRTIVLEHRFANEIYERFHSLASEFVALKVDVLVAVSRPAAVAAQTATKTIPIVFVAVPDPLGSKLVDTLARPGANITGLTHMAVDIMTKRLQLLKDMLPDLTHAALITNPNDVITARRNIEELRIGADLLKVTVRPYEVRAPNELEQIFAMIAKDGMNGVFVSNDPMLFNERARIAELALERRLPLLLTNRLGVLAGALMSYGTDSRTMFRRAATYVDKIIKGEKPGELPVEQPTKFELLINLKTAKALGLTVPPILIARADEVIE